jgi:hypothetical protein
MPMHSGRPPMMACSDAGFRSMGTGTDPRGRAFCCRACVRRAREQRCAGEEWLVLVYQDAYWIVSADARRTTRDAPTGMSRNGRYVRRAREGVVKPLQSQSRLVCMVSGYNLRRVPAVQGPGPMHGPYGGPGGPGMHPRGPGFDPAGAGRGMWPRVCCEDEVYGFDDVLGVSCVCATLAVCVCNVALICLRSFVTARGRQRQRAWGRCPYQWPGRSCRTAEWESRGVNHYTHAPHTQLC